MSVPVVTARGLTKIYPAHDGSEKRAVDNIDFDCEAGQIFGLLPGVLPGGRVGMLVTHSYSLAELQILALLKKTGPESRLKS